MGIFFLLSYTLAMGALIFAFMGLFLGMEGDYGFLMAGILIGWFTGWMLLERRVKVFNKKVFLGLVAFGLMLGGAIGLTKLDPMGIVTYVPQTDKIAEVCIYTQNDIYSYQREDAFRGWYITDPEEIGVVQKLHRQMIDTTCQGEELRFPVSVQYELENGIRVARQYDIPADSQVAQNLRPVFSDMRAVFNAGDLSRVKTALDYVYVYSNEKDKSLENFTPAMQQELIAAIEADCLAGTMAQDVCYHVNEEMVAVIDLSWDVLWDDGLARGTRNENILVYENSINTIAYLKTLGLV
jgi:ABC-2 type transport system permease protein